jgi:hypothetical protein
MTALLYRRLLTQAQADVTSIIHKKRFLTERVIGLLYERAVKGTKGNQSDAMMTGNGGRHSSSVHLNGVPYELSITGFRMRKISCLDYFLKFITFTPIFLRYL